MNGREVGGRVPTAAVAIETVKPRPSQCSSPSLLLPPQAFDAAITAFPLSPVNPRTPLDERTISEASWATSSPMSIRQRHASTDMDLASSCILARDSSDFSLMGPVAVSRTLSPSPAPSPSSPYPSNYHGDEEDEEEDEEEHRLSVTHYSHVTCTSGAQYPERSDQQQMIICSSSTHSLTCLPTPSTFSSMHVSSASSSTSVPFSSFSSSSPAAISYSSSSFSTHFLSSSSTSHSLTSSSSFPQPTNSSGVSPHPLGTCSAPVQVSSLSHTQTHSQPLPSAYLTDCHQHNHHHNIQPPNFLFHHQHHQQNENIVPEDPALQDPNPSIASVPVSSPSSSSPSSTPNTTTSEATDSPLTPPPTPPTDAPIAAPAGVPGAAASPCQLSLQAAVRSGDAGELRRLLEERGEGKVNINLIDQDGQTALHLGCLQGNLDLVKVLVSFGADVRLANRDGWAPLHMAVYGGHYHIMQYLMPLLARARGGSQGRGGNAGGGGGEMRGS